MVQIDAVVNLNGELLPASQAKVSVFDRSYLYGDSLYEVVRSYEGRFIHSQMQAHMDRLWQSARLCNLGIAQTQEELIQECERTLKHFKQQPYATKDVYCRLILSRGVGRIGFSKKALLTPSLYTILVQPVENPSADQLRRGLKLAIVQRFRNHPNALDPAMKSGNYLNNLLAYLEAAEQGFDDALLCDFEGFVTEGTTFNIFYIRRGILCTPPLPVGILDGITRRKVIEIARELRIETRESYFLRERLYEADEVFATGTVKEVMAVTQVDSQKIGSGHPGPITQKIRSAFDAAIQEELGTRA
ncbi:MAG: aminotransferase class IV [Oligoflexia bacterium]|jgi:branched-chain amino acid aminotransferase